MNTRCWFALHLLLFVGTMAGPLLAIQPGPDDKKDGFKKDFPFGPGGFGGMKQRQKLVPQFDKDKDGRLNTEERQAAREFLQKQAKGGKGGFGKGPGGFGKGGPPGGFNPGEPFARALLENLDSDKDVKLSRAEWMAGVKRFFADSDPKKTGSLDEAQIAESLNRIMPPPKKFGFGPKDGKNDGPPKDGPPKDGPPKDGPKGFPPPGGGFFVIGLGKPLATAIVQRADVDKDGKVTAAELEKAAEALFVETDKEKTGKLNEAALAAAILKLLPAPGGFGFGGKRDPAKPGPKVAPSDVKSYPDAKLYDPTVLRTIFIDFENKKDWEAELADFYHTDVEVPATITVDGKKYENVGVHFRGNSSYFGVPQGYKHSLNLSFDFVQTKQRLHGYKTLNLMNCNQDPTFMHAVLFSQIARQYMPAPQVNVVKVVINGESWGIYANQQQFNKDFLQENFKTTKGARWKVPGHPGANGGLTYLGENIADYKRHYEIKTEDKEKDWKALIELCRILNKTPPDKLEEALRPILAIEEVLWFLAIDNAVINDDGYWTRASDFELYRDPKGKFHIVAHDINETFMPMGGGFGGPKGGGGFGKGPKDGPKDGDKGPGGFGKGMFGGGGYGLDPLTGLKNDRTPLYSKLLAVPSLRAQYLKNIHTIASKDFDWKNMKPLVDRHRALIEAEVELDTRKLSSLGEFKNAMSDTPGPRGNLRAFADGRRQYLLNHPEVKKAIAP